jgi:RNA polymerase sigma factor (sigma-70 family)
MRGEVSARTDAVVRRGVPLPAALQRFVSDERLVGQVRAGSDAAFEVLYDRHHRGLLAFCRHLLGSRDDAENAVQDTFFAAYRGMVGTHKPIRVRQWLYTIARHRCISMLRARREQPVDEVPESGTANLAADVAAREDVRALLADVRRLPESQRLALVLAELGDLSHEQIAGVVGCPQAKVRALIFQARSSLLAARAARETPCREVREQIATATGGRLSRGLVRRHVAGCAGCRDFRDAVRTQRRHFASALPVVPSLELKGTVLAAVGAVSGVGAATTFVGGGVAVKSLVTAVMIGGFELGASSSGPPARPPAATAALPAHRAVAPRHPGTAGPLAAAPVPLQPASPQPPSEPSERLKPRGASGGASPEAPPGQRQRDPLADQRRHRAQPPQNVGAAGGEVPVAPVAVGALPVAQPQVGADNGGDARPVAHERHAVRDSGRLDAPPEAAGGEQRGDTGSAGRPRDGGQPAQGDGRGTGEQPQGPDRSSGRGGGDPRGGPADPRGNSGDPRGNSGDPRGNSGDPRGNSGDSQGNSGDPRGNSGDPQGNSGDPRGNSGDPRGNSGDPRGNSGDPGTPDQSQTGKLDDRMRDRGDRQGAGQQGSPGSPDQSDVLDQSEQAPNSEQAPDRPRRS